MKGLRAVASGLRDLVRLRTRWHHAAAAGAIAAVASDVVGTTELAKVAIGFVVTVAIRELDEAAGRGKRRECERRVAGAARAMLDNRLPLTRTDQMILGRWLTLRRVAELAREGRIHELIGFGAPAQDFAKSVSDSSSWFETEIGRCHDKLRAGAQDQVDAFVRAMKVVTSAAQVMLNAPFYEPATANHVSRRMYDTLAAAVANLERIGDALDHGLDPAGARRAAQERDAAARAAHAKSAAAVAVLVESGRAMVALANAIDLMTLPGQDAVYQAIARIREVGLHVDSDAFFNATEGARKAHRAMTYSTLADAQAASGNVPEVRRLLDQLPAQLAALEALAR